MRAFFLALLMLGAPAAEPETPLTFRQAVDIALAAHPGLDAARLQQEVARAAIGVARQRPNPELTVEETNELPHDLATLSQTFETAGKRRRRIQLAEAGLLTREAELARAVAEVRSRVRRAFYTLVAEQRRLAESEGLLRLAERTRDVARARFESGDVPRLDLLQAELGTAQAENDYQAAAGQVSAAQAGLNALLARRPLQAPIVVSGGLEDGAIPDLEATVRALLASSTELTALDRGIAEQQARVALTRAEQVPDPTVAGTVTHDAQPEFHWGWHAAVTLALPIFTRRGAAVQVEERTLDQLRAARAARAAEITGEVSAAAAKAAAQQKQVQRFRDQILPQAEEVERMAEDSYRSGQTGLPALLQALQATRDVRLRALQAGADYQAALADLESAMGAPLP